MSEDPVKEKPYTRYFWTVTVWDETGDSAVSDVCWFETAKMEDPWQARWIGDEYLTPYSNNYDLWLQYQTFDITEEVRQGGTLSVLLGDGWYKGRFGYDNHDGRGRYGYGFKLLAEIRILHEDGSITVIGTDESWTRTDSNITSSNLYDGETVDDTLPEGKVCPAEIVEGPSYREWLFDEK